MRPSVALDRSSRLRAGQPIRATPRRGTMEIGAASAFASPRPRVSVLGPVFEEAANLPILVAEIHRALADRAGDYEVVLVDDASADDSWRILEELASASARVRIDRLPRRSGQSAALARALELASGEILVTIDTDLQNDPADIPRLLDLVATWDVVSGRRVRRRDTLVRRLASWIANRVRRWVLGDPFTDVGCALRVYRAEFLRAAPSFRGAHRYFPVLAHHMGARCIEVDVNHRPRLHGESKYSAAGDRLWAGLADLVGVRWWMSRTIRRPEALLPRDPGRS